MKGRRRSRLFWGVLFTGGSQHKDDNAPFLLYGGWCDIVRRRQDYDAEPSRALLFRSRAAARRWCQARRDTYRDRTDCCRLWRFRPVRVRETVEVLV